MATPYGIITMWYSGSTTIPAGWSVCDGTGGTPDLRSYFIMGASNDSEYGVVSGCASHAHSSPGLDSVPDHSHDVSGGTSSMAGSSGATNSGGACSVTGTHSHGFSVGTSSAGGHGHTVGTSGSAAVLPPYYKLFYIMKV